MHPRLVLPKASLETFKLKFRPFFRANAELPNALFSRHFRACRQTLGQLILVLGWSRHVAEQAAHCDSAKTKAIHDPCPS
jgi:hypothetical protein